MTLHATLPLLRAHEPFKIPIPETSSKFGKEGDDFLQDTGGKTDKVARLMEARLCRLK